MKAVNRLQERIAQRVGTRLKQIAFDVEPHIEYLVSGAQGDRLDAVYGITDHHPLNLILKHTSLAGSYFLGNCQVKHSILYKSDVRGDELKQKGDRFTHQGAEIDVLADESIRIEDSCLIKTLVHNFSHDPEHLEEFKILNTCAAHYANIHGAPTEGSFLGPLSTVDLTTVNNCVIGHYAYVQAGEITQATIEPGTIWIQSENGFKFRYRYPSHVLDQYITYDPSQGPQGILFDFMEAQKEALSQPFEHLGHEGHIDTPAGTSIDDYAILKGQCEIETNVLISQRAYLENAYLGKGSNAQEHCDVIHSHLTGDNVTAHGAKIIHTHLGHTVFVGFNSFLRGSGDCPLKIGAESIVMPHSIIDLKAPVTIEPRTLVWGYIASPKDLATQSMPIEEFAGIKTRLERGDLQFEGDGSMLIAALQSRIHHILEANGAFFDRTGQVGHAQQHRHIAYNTLQAYPKGDLRGIYPTIEISPYKR